MRKYVMDTSIFVNPQVRGDFGSTPEKAITGFCKIAKKNCKACEFYMPSSIFSELSNFAGKRTDDLEMVVKRRSPNVYAIYLPAAVFYDFVEDVRERINKGLRLAEAAATDRKTPDSERVRILREKYKTAMRTGILDSKEDFELVLLAKELDATLVSADNGVLDFANKIGCEILHASKFRKSLLSK
jgi:uncharacterized protein